MYKRQAVQRWTGCAGQNVAELCWADDRAVLDRLYRAEHNWTALDRRQDRDGTDVRIEGQIGIARADRVIEMGRMKRANIGVQ